MTTFKRVILVPGQAEIAKVNRKTGVLYLSSHVWDGLPADEKEFVLLHEKGHLMLETANEFQANKYAVKNYMKAGTFTNAELGQKIMVMRSILDKADGQTSNFSDDTKPSISGNDIYGIGAGLNAIFSNISVLGIGSKARQREAEATANSSALIYNAEATAAAKKSKSRNTMILISGVFVLLSIVIYLTLRKK